jgi:hypothetical protein
VSGGLLLALLLATPVPPPMPHRTITEPTTAPSGRSIEIVDGAYVATLFVPAAFEPSETASLTVHFHGEPWFVIDEHLRRGLDGPLLVCSFGQGSSTYAKPFLDVDRFGRMVAAVERELSGRVRQIDITSFSAGYGAVREILRQDRYVDRIRRVILCDSLYASWDSAATRPGATSRPSEEHMNPFAKFVELAAAGKKTFVLAHSQVPTPYANTAATAAWVIDHVHAPLVRVAPDDTPAARDDRFPLLYRADLGHLHVWGYGGTDAQAHLTSVRHLAEIWRALDDAGDR